MQQQRRKRWAAAEDSYLSEHWHRETAVDIAAHLGRSPEAVRRRASRIGLPQGKTWPRQDADFLQAHWGHASIDYICRHLGRTRKSVEMKAYRMGLGAQIMSTDEVCLSTLMMAVQHHHISQESMTKLLRLGIPVKKRRPAGQQIYHTISLPAWWRWAKEHRHDLDFSRFEPLALGKEPGWVAHKRQVDRDNAAVHRPRELWTAETDARLRMLLTREGMTMERLSAELGRSGQAIRNHMTVMGCTIPPPLSAYQGHAARWQAEQVQLAAELMADGWSMTRISLRLGRTDQAIRKQIKTVYGTMDRYKLGEILSKKEKEKKK